MISLQRGQKFLFILISFFIILTSCRSTKEQVQTTIPEYPKREFRGAWLSTMWQDRYMKMSSSQMKQYFVNSLNELQRQGINAIIFQVRPQADAFYKSDLEPWSRFLTGTQGKAPDGNFDPLAFLIQECHKRNMELHAWLNPYRVGSESQQFVSNHIYYRQPERFVKYNKQIYFDPGLPENREYICRIVKDIVSRYDVDAIHMDDYFYPYPVAGQNFPDDNSFNKYAAKQGFKKKQRDDWRRNNVNLLIKELKRTIVVTKPWVRFGISPFGIYRNKKSTADGSGSDTNGLQNYDDLYADVKLWVEKGWIDYNMPQIYWENGHSLADYTTLVNWWAANNYKQPLYIGQDVERTMNAKSSRGGNQLNEKIKLSRSFTDVHGNCFWPAYTLLDNYKDAGDELKNKYHRYPALIPAYVHMHNKAPKDVKKIKEVFTEKEHYLEWERNGKESNPESAQYYVIYRFGKGENVNLSDPRKIVRITRNTKYVLPYEKGKNKYQYIITSVDAFHNESKGKSKNVTL